VLMKLKARQAKRRTQQNGGTWSGGSHRQRGISGGV